MHLAQLGLCLYFLVLPMGRLGVLKSFQVLCLLRILSVTDLSAYTDARDQVTPALVACWKMQPSGKVPVHMLQLSGRPYITVARQ